jgi:oxalate decarboxylase/phosphoglucose isomerase-like protein (cupin superfamily)
MPTPPEIVYMPGGTRTEIHLIHIVEGEFEMTIDGRVARVVGGQTVHIPAGVVHSGINVGPSPGRRLLTFSPAGMEEFFREAGAASPDAEPDRSATADAAVRHGWRFVD